MKLNLMIIYLAVIFAKVSPLLKVNYVEKDATSQSLTYMNASSSLAVDKNPNTCSISYSTNKDSEKIWWNCKLDGVYVVKSVIVLFSSNKSIGINYMNNIDVHVVRFIGVYRGNICASFNKSANNSGHEITFICKYILIGDQVNIRRNNHYQLKMLVLCEVTVYADIDTVSMAYGRPTFQGGSQFQQMSKLPVDGFRETCGKVKADGVELAWWRVILDKPSYISAVTIIYKRNSTATLFHDGATFNNFQVFVSNDDNNFEDMLCAKFVQPSKDQIQKGYAILKCSQYSTELKMDVDKSIFGRYVTIKKLGGTHPQWLILCEVQVFTAPWITECLETDFVCDIISRCLPSAQKCDRIKQCPDGSDELNCECLANEFQCNGGFCIKKDWVCDNIVDCRFKDDELHSCNCKEGQFKCDKSPKCLNDEDRCDGEVECPDFSDENGCFSIQDDFLKLKYRGHLNFFVCSMNWLPEFSLLVCKQHFNSLLLKSKYSRLKGSPDRVMHLAKEKYNKKVLPGFQSWRLSPPPFCLKEEYVKLECLNTSEHESERFCGKRASQEEMGMYIVNGVMAVKGAWPWHVQIIINNLYACEGSILYQEWILTIASCLEGASSDSDIKVKVGTTIRNDPAAESLGVSMIITHPKYITSHNSKNIALIKVASPLKYSEFVWPICLPTGKLNDKDLYSFHYCVVTSFGNIDKVRTESTYLMQGRFDIISTDRCVEILYDKNFTHVSRYVLDHKMLCAGDMLSDIGTNLCAGDGGSPLVCKDNTGAWVQVGIAIGVDITEGVMPCSVSIFNRIDDEMELINSAIRPKDTKDTISRNIPGLFPFLFLLFFSTFLA